MSKTLAVKAITGEIVKKIPSIKDYEEMDPEQVLKILDNVSATEKFAKYHLACTLYVIRQNGSWKKAQKHGVAYPTFAEWVYHTHGYDGRTVRYLTSIINSLKGLELSEAEIEQLMMIGWKKIYHITRVVKTRQELQKWIGFAENQSNSELESSVRLELATRSGEELDGVKGRVQEESKIEALDVKIRFKTSENFSIFKTVYGYIEKKFGTSSPEDVISLMAAQYMATANPDTNIKLDLNNHIKALEKLHGVKIKVVR